MFNLYQNLNKRDDGEHRDADVTGHDRFWQERSKTRRKRRAANRRTQSAIELDSEAMLSARGTLRRGRSASIEDEDSEEEKGYQLTNKIDNLAKILFSRVSAARGWKDTDSSRRAAWLDNNDSNVGPLRNPWLANLIRFYHRLRIVLPRRRTRRAVSAHNRDLVVGSNLEIGCLVDRYGRHNYTALGHGPSACDDAGEYVEMEKRSRDRALSICQAYIQGTPRYSLVKQLNNIGSRVNKHWFTVLDTSLKATRLITIVPLNRNCSLSPSTKDILSNFQHPYIFPVFDLDLFKHENQTYVILVQPISHGGLKDLIYGVERSGWIDDWNTKYSSLGKKLPLPQVQRMGRQVLEALVFLKERGFPTVTHLHSGNVLVQNGVARLAGLENTILGFTSRIHPIVTSRARQNTSIDMICFGHMLFEMCAGYELRSFKPTSVQLSELEMYPQVVEVLKLIFDQPGNRHRSIEELLIHDLFRNIDLREMRSTSVTIFRPTLTPSIVNLLDGIKQQNVGKRATDLDNADMISLHSPEAGCEESLLVQIYNELSNTAV